MPKHDIYVSHPLDMEALEAGSQDVQQNRTGREVGMSFESGR